jgi:plastocyanin
MIVSTHPVRLAALAVVAVLLAACSSGGDVTAATAPPGVDATIQAQNQHFSADGLSLPAGKPARLFFKNIDSAPHNVAIYADASASQKVFVGATISNAVTTYDIPAIAAGQYVFRCDIHPDMKGSLTVGG